MEFNNSTNKEISLYHDALGLAGIPESDTTTMPIATFTRNVNSWYRRLVFYAWRNSNRWQFDDSNQTTLPEATTTLVVGQQDYTIDSTAIDILEVYVKNGSGDYQKLTRINPFMITGARDEYGETNGMPMEWYLEGSSIILKPAPAAGDVTLAIGLKIIFDRDISAFVITDTTKEPGFNSSFHRILSLGPAYDFSRSYGLISRINTIKPDLDEMIAEFEQYHSKRSKTDKKRIKPNTISSI